MYRIKIKATGNGRLDVGSERLKLGTTGENQRLELEFILDSTIEGNYQYVKFTSTKATFLYRLTNNIFVVTKSILAFDGIWKMSFISTNAVIQNNRITGTYAYISEPIECVIVRGILDDDNPTDEETALNNICSMNFQELVIPESVKSIGAYFMYNSRKTFSLTIGRGVTSIGAYAFYDATISKLEFESSSELTTLYDYAFYHVTINDSVTFPKSITSWGKYVLQNSSVISVTFEANSNLRSLGSYAFWDNSVQYLQLPDRLNTLSGNTYVIKNCTSLTRLWIPNTITTIIPANAIYGCGKLTTIELEKDFNVSANFSNCLALTRDAIVNMLYALKNLNGSTAKTLTLGSTNLAKLSDGDIAIATNKNWTLS